jgi:hypothetical protein
LRLEIFPVTTSDIRCNATNLIDGDSANILADAPAIRARIVSLNLQRRHSKVGSRAMSLAMIFPEPEKRSGKAGQSSSGKADELAQVANISGKKDPLRISKGFAEAADISVGTAKTLSEANKVSTALISQARIVSLNIHRRHLKKGQQAMALAMMYPEPIMGRGKVSRFHETLQVSKGTAQNLISQARTVLRHSVDLAERVRDGAEALDTAYGEVVNDG